MTIAGGFAQSAVSNGGISSDPPLMSDHLGHECGVALVRLLKPLSYYQEKYGSPLWGDYAIVKVKLGAAVPDLLTAGLFDEHWQLPK